MAVKTKRERENQMSNSYWTTDSRLQSDIRQRDRQTDRQTE